MESITVKNFRCFGEEQTARLAPLTLLVGDNSTGKTSFLALIRAMWDVAFAEIAPDFQEHPYDLGSFRDIAHAYYTESETTTFNAWFEQNRELRVFFYATFGNRDGAPYPFKRRVERQDRWIELMQDLPDGPSRISYGDSETAHDAEIKSDKDRFSRTLLSLSTSALRAEFMRHRNDLDYLVSSLSAGAYDLVKSSGNATRPYASAPIRSRPSRTYDPIAPSRDAEGLYTPTFLARTSMHGGDDWELLRNGLVDFGRLSGLFDDILVHHLGTFEGSPFQIHVRKPGDSDGSPNRNLVDMGYGISQVLPILTELLRPDGPQLFLLQQPEVHLHPSAQAALGSLFCSMATAGKQVIVETHSEYIVDRIRMDVRDGSSDLSPDDVSVLYFERSEQSVKIHSLSFGDDGELINAPPGYGQFFMDEVNRSIGI